MLRRGSRYVQERLAQKIVMDVCRQFQPCTSAETNPTLTLTLTLARTRTRTLWGARGRQGQSRGSAACVGGVFSLENAGRPKDPP